MLKRVGLLILVTLLVFPAMASASGRTLKVAPDGPYRTIADALAAAVDGDIIHVEGGVHPGPITVERSIRLIGSGEPVLDGGGTGTVVRIKAPGVEVRGFHIQGSGVSLDQENAGVYVEAPEAIIADNLMEDVLFGVYLKAAPRSLVERNSITGKAIDMGLVGDGIRLWKSSDSVVQENHLRKVRQMIIQHSDRVKVLRNRLEDSLLGIHSMVASGTYVAENRIERCDVGIYAMYGFDVIIRNNRIAHSRGPSGYGIGLKDMDNITVEGNELTDNRAGIYLDNSPRVGGDGRNLVRGNILAGNDGALVFQPSVSGNTLTQNNLIDNIQHIEILGGGRLAENTWTLDGLGNYWSDYAGYDADGDGVGDLPYQPRSLYESLSDQYPVLDWFLASPAVSAVEMAARVFPTMAGPPRITDAAPLVKPLAPGTAVPALAPAGEAPRSRPLALPVGMLAGAAGLLSLALYRRERL